MSSFPCCRDLVRRYAGSKEYKLPAAGSRQGQAHTLRLGVKGSGRRMLRGKADRMRLRIWMHEGGTTLHSSKWYSHRNSGKSCSSTSSTRSVPCSKSTTRNQIFGIVKYPAIGEPLCRSRSLNWPDLCDYQPLQQQMPEKLSPPL